MGSISSRCAPSSYLVTHFLSLGLLRQTGLISSIRVGIEVNATFSKLEAFLRSNGITFIGAAQLSYNNAGNPDIDNLVLGVNPGSDCKLT